MRSLAGKTIPMWVNDPTGSEAAKNPRAKTRTTDDGRKQILIFRRAAPIGQRKTSVRMVNGLLTRTSVPASYPGAPGRIAVNRSQGMIRRGDGIDGEGRAGQIATKNVGVRWRHPGLDARRALAKGVTIAAVESDIIPQGVRYLNSWSEQIGPLITVVYQE